MSLIGLSTRFAGDPGGAGEGDFAGDPGGGFAGDGDFAGEGDFARSAIVAVVWYCSQVPKSQCYSPNRGLGLDRFAGSGGCRGGCFCRVVCHFSHKGRGKKASGMKKRPWKRKGRGFVGSLCARMGIYPRSDPHWRTRCNAGCSSGAGSFSRGPMRAR